MKTVILTSLKLAGLTVVLFICFIIAGGVASPVDTSQTSNQAGTAALLLAVCFLNAVVLTYLILRSCWTGFKLMVAVFWIFFGVMTLMSLIEAAVFVTFPPGVLPRLFIMGLLVTAPFSVLAVLILKRRSPGVAEPRRHLSMPGSEWAWKLAVIAAVYVIIYFTFGYFIAWRDPAVREYYGGVDPGGFFAQIGSVVRDTPWLFPFQIVRAMLWTLLALPIVRMLKGSRYETAFGVGLVFCVVMNAQILLPNPYMPEAVRMTHLLETATSNFIFGVFVGWLLSRPPGVAKTRVSEDEDLKA